jgi:hypothetical protein
MRIDYKLLDAAEKELGELLSKVEPLYQEKAQRIFYEEVGKYMKLLEKVPQSERPEAGKISLKIAKDHALVAAGYVKRSYAYQNFQEKSKMLQDFDVAYPDSRKENSPEPYKQKRTELRLGLKKSINELKSAMKVEDTNEWMSLNKELEQLVVEFRKYLPKKSGRRFKDAIKSILVILAISSALYLSFSSYFSANGLYAASSGMNIINTAVGVALFIIIAFIGVRYTKE